MDRINGRTIVITGAARGARVVIDDRDIALLEKAVGSLSNLGMVSGHPLDVADAESFGTFLAKARIDGGGHMVNIASLAGVVAVPGQVVYAGTKFAVGVIGDA